MLQASKLHQAQTKLQGEKKSLFQGQRLSQIVDTDHRIVTKKPVDVFPSLRRSLYLFNQRQTHRDPTAKANKEETMVKVDDSFSVLREVSTSSNLLLTTFTNSHPNCSRPQEFTLNSPNTM